MITGHDRRTAKSQCKIYGTNRPVSAGTVLRCAAKDEPRTIEKTPGARRGSGSAVSGLSPPGSNRPRPATAREPVSPWVRGAATTSARRTNGRGGDDEDNSFSKTPPPKAVTEYVSFFLFFYFRMGNSIDVVFC